MNGRGHWLCQLPLQVQALPSKTGKIVQGRRGNLLPGEPVDWPVQENSGLLSNMKIIKLLSINPLPLIILRGLTICQQYSPIDFHSCQIRGTALISAGCFQLLQWCNSLHSLCLWWYSFPLSAECFLKGNKLHFFMAYGKLPWLLLLLYPLCELNMYSVARCLRCYCWVTYGTNSIRMKLALDNPSDCMPSDPFLGWLLWYQLIVH